MGIKDRISELLHRNKYTLPILQGLGMIALVTAISIVSIHLLLGDTISDYAEANPEVAYGRETESIPETETQPEAQADVAVSTEDTITDKEPEVTTEESAVTAEEMLTDTDNTNEVDIT